MEIFHILWRIVVDLADLTATLVLLPGRWWLLIIWVVWWLFAVNWSRAWNVLRTGSWMPLVLLTALTALVWSRLAPQPCDCLGAVRLPNFWWQLAATALLVGVALFCGWLQGVIRYTPPEVSFEPALAADHGHEHHH